MLIFVIMIKDKHNSPMNIHEDGRNAEKMQDLLNGKRILELEAALIKSDAALEGYKEGERAKRGTDYSRYIIMGIAAVEGLVLILERLI